MTEVHVPAPGLLSACSSSQGATLVSVLLLGCTCGTADTQHRHGYTAGSLKMVSGQPPAAVQPHKCSFRREESIAFPVCTQVLFSLGPKQFRHQSLGTCGLQLSCRAWQGGKVSEIFTIPWCAPKHISG